MSKETPKLSVTASSRIMKYAEGANPDVDEPIEIIEKVEVIEGQAALDYIKQMNGHSKRHGGAK